MQKLIYTCDQCGVQLGDKKHITLQFGEYSGIAKKSKEGTWGVHNKLNGKFVHFCNSVCIGKVFRELMAAVK